jgi:inositol polyphosphate-4-phosphatase
MFSSFSDKRPPPLQKSTPSPHTTRSSLDNGVTSLITTDSVQRQRPVPILGTNGTTKTTDVIIEENEENEENESSDDEDALVEDKFEDIGLSDKKNSCDDSIKDDDKKYYKKDYTKDSRKRIKTTSLGTLGLNLSIQLSGVCDSSDGLFTVCYGGKLSADQLKKLNEPGYNLNLSDVEWCLMGRTEVVSPTDAGSIVSSVMQPTDSLDSGDTSGGGIYSSASGYRSNKLVCRTFSLMITNPSKYNISTIMFVVYKATSFSEDFKDHQELAWGVVKSDSVISNKSNDVNSVNRISLNAVGGKDKSLAGLSGMNDDLGLKIPEECFVEPERVAWISVEKSESVAMTKRVAVCSQRLGYESYPFVYKMYGFQSLTGLTFVREELHLPKYCLSVPKALLGLLLEERMPSVERLLGVVERELDVAQKVLDGLQNSASNKKHSNSLLDNGDMTEVQVLDIMDDQIMYVGRLAMELEQAESRVNTLKRGKEVLLDVEKKMRDEYIGCYKYCNDALVKEEEAGMEYNGGTFNETDDKEESEKSRSWRKSRKEKKMKGKSDGTSSQQMGIPVHMGGHRLKKSVQKKVPLLAFIPTNLNMELMHVESVRNRIARKEESGGEESKPGVSGKKTDDGVSESESDEDDGARPIAGVSGVSQTSSSGSQSQQQQLDTFSTATFGVPSAHSLGSKNGGLRRLLLSQSTDGVFCNDSDAWMQRTEQKKKIQQTKEDPLRISSVENDLSTSRAAQVCALHARGLEMTVADLQSHASGRRRNSILKVAAMSSSFAAGSVNDPVAAAAAAAAAAAEADELSQTERANAFSSDTASTAGGGDDSDGVKRSRLTGDVEDWIKCAELMHRVDIVTSQMLSIAVSVVQNTLAMAASGSPHHVNILPRILEVGFLVSVESLLSAYGGELCMLEDLAVAVEWLSTVTIRFVENVKARKPGGVSRSDAPSRDEQHDYTDTSAANRRGFGYSEGVWIRRGTRGRDIRFSQSERGSSGCNDDGAESEIAGIKWGELIVDIEVNSAVAHAIREAKAITLESKSRHKEHIFKKLTRRASSPIMGLAPTSGILDDHFVKGGADEEKGEDDVPKDPMQQPKRAPRFADLKNAMQGINKALHSTPFQKRRDNEPSKFGADDEVAAAAAAEEAAAAEQEAANEEEKNNAVKVVDTEWGCEGKEISVLAAVKLTGVLFTQGINAQQTLVNVRAGGDSSIQTSINRASMQRLKNYAGKYKQAMIQQRGTLRYSMNGAAGLHSPHVPLSTQASEVSGKAHETPVQESVRDELGVLETLLNKAQATVNDSCVFSNEKNVNVLLKTSDLCRFMNGTHGVMCKSGKDRSSMAVTLEQARYLCSQHGVVGGKKSCEIMRRHGVRRYNVWANTGQKNFAFNGFNHTSLPKCMKPPPGCYSGSVQT